VRVTRDLSRSLGGHDAGGVGRCVTPFRRQRFFTGQQRRFQDACS
jgi:hypothetical protein